MMGYIVYGKEWNELTTIAKCVNCGHSKIEHSHLEKSLGNPSHECEKLIKVKKATYSCCCRRFELTKNAKSKQGDEKHEN